MQIRSEIQILRPGHSERGDAPVAPAEEADVDTPKSGESLLKHIADALGSDEDDED